MSKVAIVTAATPGFLGDAGAVLRRSVEQYAARHSVDVFAPQIVEFPRPPAWAKVSLLLGKFDAGFTHLLWVDADVLALPEGPHPRRMFENAGGEDLYVAVDENGINSGVLGVRISESARMGLEWVWSQTQYLHHGWWEQAAIHDLHRREPARFRIVDKAIWNAYPGEERQGRTAFLHFPGSQKPHLGRYVDGSRGKA